jgi:dipeptidyl aminopeptidase/acylaminoacyl peptidase
MAKPKKLLTVDDLWKIERVGGVSLSPDAAQAVCTLSTHSMDDNKGASALWLLSTFGGEPRRLTSCGEKDGQAAWSPRGDAIAFVAKREQQGRKDDTPQLYVIAPDGGEARRVSDFAPGVEAFKWFPDGRRIAFVAWVWPELKGTKAQARRHKEFKDRKESGYATSETQYRYWDANLPMGRVAHLHVLDIASGRISDLFEGQAFELPRAEPDANGFDIAPGGRHLVFSHDPSAQQQIEHCHALTEIDLRSGRAETVLLDKHWSFEAPRYSPDGTRIAFVASEQGRKITAPLHAAVWQRGGRWQLLSDTWDHNVDAPLRWAADGSALHFTAEDRGRRHLYRYTLGSRTASIVAEGGWVQGFDVAANVCVSVADAMDHPARVHAHRGGQPAQRLERFNDERLAAFALGTTREVRFKGARGDEVQMWLVHPPGVDPAKPGKKKLPVLHSIHGGPHAAAGDTFHYRWNTQVFAAQGYLVACVNYHGSSGFGQAFLDSITGRFGELELQDVEAATDWLLKQPLVDRKRVFASGGSYGGYMVAWMNGHVKPGRYNAYVCHAGCYDWTAMFADDCYTAHAREFGAFYWDDPVLVGAQSPSTFAKSMRTPTLVVHGALDYRVPDAQGLAYYNTLKAQGVDARLLWFPDETHWVLKPRNSRLWYIEFFAWLARHDTRAGRTPAPRRAKAAAPKLHR